MKMLKSFLFVVVLIIVAAIGFSRCGKGGKLTSITITPADISITNGTSLQYQAQGHLSDNATYFLSSAKWTSSDPTVAKIDPTLGFLVALNSSGTVTITASDPYSNFTGTTTLIVSPVSSLTVTPANPSMSINTSHQFTVTGILANGATQDLTSNLSTTWMSSDPTATVSNPGGIVTTLATTGTTTIFATFSQVLASSPTTTYTATYTGYTVLNVTATPLQSLTIDPTAAVISLPTGTQQFTVTGKLTDGTTPWQGSAVWSSSNTTVATIDINSGLATAGTTTGVTTITATDPITSLASSATLTVQ